MRTLSGFVRIWVSLKPYVLLRKDAQLRRQRLILYNLHPRYPATLEAAVQSGFAAAEKLMLDLQVE